MLLLELACSFRHYHAPLDLACFSVITMPQEHGKRTPPLMQAFSPAF